MESDSEIPPEDTRCVVTLVHGTFAKHAPWMRDHSPLCMALKAMFLNHFVSTTAEPAPVGASPAHIFHAEPEGGEVKPGLAHSGIYEDKAAIAQIVGWITNRSDA
jgi:hypothetical protein